MIVLTGGAGFIGSAVLWKLNNEGIDNIIIVDKLSNKNKWKNLVGKKINDFIDKKKFISLVQENYFRDSIESVIHMGACSSTTECDADYLMQNNYQYTLTLAKWCIEKNIRFIYASSGATYGDGSLGFSDDDKITYKLQPLNIYGFSKHLFDLWVLKNNADKKIVGLKFFNIFGPNEYHKENMASVVYKAYKKIKKEKIAELFKSNDPKYKDGDQKRDFLYVKDCVNIIFWFLKNTDKNGIYNLGSGQARTWNDLISASFKALGLETNIKYISMPEELKKKYQNYTQANIGKLKKVGCNTKFMSLEKSIEDYIKNYLEKENQYL